MIYSVLLNGPGARYSSADNVSQGNASLEHYWNKNELQNRHFFFILHPLLNIECN